MRFVVVFWASQFHVQQTPFWFLLFQKTLWLLRRQSNMYLNPEYPVIARWNNRNKNGYCICKTVYRCLISSNSLLMKWNILANYCLLTWHAILKQTFFFLLKPWIGYVAVNDVYQTFLLQCFIFLRLNMIGTLYKTNKQSKEISEKKITLLIIVKLVWILF